MIDMDEFGDNLLGSTPPEFDLTKAMNEMVDAGCAPFLRPDFWRRRQGWWTTTPAEHHFLNLPDFGSGAERMKFMLARMAKATLDEAGAGADDEVLPYHLGDGRRSLNQMLDEIDQLEHERVKVWMDRPR